MRHEAVGSIAKMDQTLQFLSRPIKVDSTQLIIPNYIKLYGTNRIAIVRFVPMIHCT